MAYNFEEFNNYIGGFIYIDLYGIAHFWINGYQFQDRRNHGYNLRNSAEIMWKVPFQNKEI